MKNILNDRTLLRFTGEDAKTFLHGILTQDFKIIENNTANFSLMLTPQGKYQFDMFIYNQDNIIYMDIATHLLESFLKKFKMHKLRANVICENLNNDFHISVSDQIDTTAFISFQDPRYKDLGYRSFIEKSNTTNIQDYTQEYHKKRYALGIMDGVYDFKTQSTIVLEAGFEELNAINWKKGCYMGQELMSRIARRKLMKKRMLIIPNPNPQELFLEYSGINDELTSLPLIYADNSKAGRIYRSRFSNQYLIASLYIGKLDQDTYIKINDDDENENENGNKIQITINKPTWVQENLFTS